ncbi:MAG: hypothetical protein ACK4XY_02530 [Chloroherpetonaceae bacterium]
MKIAEVEIEYRARSFKEGKKFGGTTLSVCFVRFGSVSAHKKR